jgi:hypothetical protein
MGMDARAQIIIGYKVKDLIKITTDRIVTPLYDQYTGKRLSTMHTSYIHTYTAFTGKSLPVQNEDADDWRYGDEDIEEYLLDFVEDLLHLESGQKREIQIYRIDHEDYEPDAEGNDIVGISLYDTGSHRNDVFFTPIACRVLELMTMEFCAHPFFEKVGAAPIVYLYNDVSY